LQNTSQHHLLPATCYLLPELDELLYSQCCPVFRIALISEMGGISGVEKDFNAKVAPCYTLLLKKSSKKFAIANLFCDQGKTRIIT